MRCSALDVDADHGLDFGAGRHSSRSWFDKRRIGVSYQCCMLFRLRKQHVKAQ